MPVLALYIPVLALALYMVPPWHPGYTMIHAPWHAPRCVLSVSAVLGRVEYGPGAQTRAIHATTLTQGAITRASLRPHNR